MNPDEQPSVHPSAEVADDARVGPGTRIWHHAQIREGAVVGRDCVIGRDAYIDAGVRIGDRVKIQNGALLYRGVTVGSGVFIGPGAILTNDRTPRATDPAGRTQTAADWMVSEVRLADGCSIGAGAIVVAGVDVGRHAMIGAGAVVTRRVPDHALVAGNPARRLGWVCMCGARLESKGSTWLCVRDGRRYEVAGERVTELAR